MIRIKYKLPSTVNTVMTDRRQLNQVPVERNAETYLAISDRAAAAGRNTTTIKIANAAAVSTQNNASKPQNP
jgi:hypothetical protein